MGTCLSFNNKLRKRAGKLINPFWLKIVALSKTTLFFFAFVGFIIFTHWGMLQSYLMQPSDGTRSVYPDLHWIAKELLSGNYPSWNPYDYGGIPFPCYGGGVIDLCGLPFFFFLPDTAATVMSLGQMSVLFISLFFWLRLFGFSKVSSFLASGMIIWSGPVMFWYGYGYPYSAYIYAVISMILVSIYYRRNNVWYLLLLSCTVAMSALSMSIQHQLNVPIAILVIALTWFVQNGQIRPMMLVFLFLGLGYCMAAIHILPLFHSLSNIGRNAYNYGDMFHCSPVSLFLAIWSGKEPSIKYGPIYFFICPLLLVGFIMFFVRKCGKKYDLAFVITGLVIFALFIVPMYVVPWIFPAYRIADPYRQWFILLLALAVASARAYDTLWKDLSSWKSRPRSYCITGIIVGLFFALFKGLEAHRRLDILSVSEAIGFFLLPATALPFLFLQRNVWIRTIAAIVLFGYSYCFIGYKIRTVHVQTLAQNPNGYRDLEKSYANLIRGASPGAVFSVYNLRYWGQFDMQGPLEPAVSSIWGLRNTAGPKGFIFLPQNIKDVYYRDGIIADPGNNFWHVIYPKMVCSDAKILARYGIEILLVHKNDINDFALKANETKLTTPNNDKINPNDWSIFPSDIHGIGEYILLLNKKYVGRAYIQNVDSSLRGLPILIDKPKYVSIDVRGLPKGTRVVLADNYFQGWRVTVDGVSVKPDAFNRFRSVTLPKEASVVEWSYSSKYVRIGVAISVFSVLTAITFSWFTFKKGRR